jgi:glycosyltransferase involved in cell wall biosynthesis
LGKAALYFDPNSCDDLAKKIEKVLSDKSLRTELSEKGLKQSAKYKWDKAVSETYSVYKYALKI